MSTTATVSSKPLASSRPVTGSVSTGASVAAPQDTFQKSTPTRGLNLMPRPVARPKAQPPAPPGTPLGQAQAACAAAMQQLQQMGGGMDPITQQTAMAEVKVVDDTEAAINGIATQNKTDDQFGQFVGMEDKQLDGARAQFGALAGDLYNDYLASKAVLATDGQAITGANEAALQQNEQTIGGDVEQVTVKDDMGQ